MEQDMDKTLRLHGRRIVVTGAASGIGKATAELLRAEGAQLVLLDMNPVADQDNLGPAFSCNVADATSAMAAVAQAASALGGIDGVVNAAGIMRTGPTSQITPKTWAEVIGVNLSGTFHVISACLPWLEAAKGAAIVNIASGAGILPNAPGLSAYAASKGGVIALTKALASDLAPRIRVNCICPGMVDTPMADGHRANVGNYALKRIADPMEIARSILFLLSNDASYITGATLAVDGGRTFH
jgi:NAD(P)-dependent dehydrogenase (short-subunit alcohol dehydrogenase family)